MCECLLGLDGCLSGAAQRGRETTTWARQLSCSFLTGLRGRGRQTRAWSTTSAPMLRPVSPAPAGKASA
jgi:hypothetical protein